MIASLGNIVQPICSRSNVHGDSVSLLFLPGFRNEDLQGKAAKVQASVHSEGTKGNYGFIWSLYDKFTRVYALKRFTATPETLSSFIMFGRFLRQVPQDRTQLRFRTPHASVLVRLRRL